MGNGQWRMTIPDSPFPIPGSGRARLLPDRELVRAMRDEDPWAWAEFRARFLPGLEEYARLTRIPREAWDDCVSGLLDAEAMRLARADAKVPDDMRAYLVCAVRNAYRRHARRARTVCDRQRVAAERWGGDDVVTSVLSAHTLRERMPPWDRDGQGDAPRDDGDGAARDPLARIIAQVNTLLTPAEAELLQWMGTECTHRELAAHLGIGMHAAAKRMQRLAKRLRVLVWMSAERIGPEAVDALERVAPETRPARTGKGDG